MSLFALDPWWNDFWTVGGFVVGVVGFAVTIWQILRTKKAIIASREAAAKTFEENRSSFERFIGDYASRLVSELLNAVNAKDWKLAKIRAEDIAELLATLRDRSDPSILIVEVLRVFGHVFAEKATRANAPFDRVKYRELLSRVHSRLDTLRAPFREESRHEQYHDATRGQNQVTGSRAAGEDQGPVGELGSEPR